MTLQAEPSAEQRLAPARAEAPPLFAAGAARPDPRALQLALVDAASARYRAGGRFAWHFARGKLGMITLNRPKVLNALSLEMIRHLTRVLQDWRTDPAVKAVALRGMGKAGDGFAPFGAFCAGGDIRFFHQAALSGDPGQRDRDALADLALVGGSLVANGGHNLLEPAALGKPLLAGPHLFNFLEIAAQLREAGDLLEVADAGQLHAALSLLFADPAEARRRAEAGLGVLRANQGALARLLAGLQVLLKRA